MKFNNNDFNLDDDELMYSIDFVEDCEYLKNSLIEMKHFLDQLLLLKAQYNMLSLPAKIELDLFLLFALNSLKFLKLQIKGVDPSTHPVATQLQHVREAMIKWQQECDRMNRPRLDIPAVRRFIRGGLRIRNVGYQPYNKNRQL